MPIFLVFLLVVIVLAMAIGVLCIVLSHQREMAGIGRQNSDIRVEALERRVEELSQVVYQQTIALDGAGRSWTPDERNRTRVEA